MAQATELKPAWKRWFWWFVLGILLVPALGLGLVLIIWLFQKNRYLRYRVTNQTIKSIDRKFTEAIDIVNIKSVEVHQPALLKLLNVGDLILKTNSRELVVKGQENPQQVAGMIEHAIKAELKRLEELNKTEISPAPPPTPGTLDRMDYLTGLWQQGLISNEDYEKEKKHFEKDSGQ